MKTLYKVDLPIPFYSQMYDRLLDDLDGFSTRQEAGYWEERGCGIACLRMIIDGYRIQDKERSLSSYGVLVSEGVQVGAYCERGWIHRGLVDLARRYGISGRTFRAATVNTLACQLRKNRPCIASVTVCFEGGVPGTGGENLARGGHLVVVHGLLGEKDSVEKFLVNHPSSSLEYNWQDLLVDRQVFENSFSGAFMAFWK